MRTDEALPLAAQPAINCANFLSGTLGCQPIGPTPLSGVSTRDLPPDGVPHPARRSPKSHDFGGLFSAHSTSHWYRARIDLAGTPLSTPPFLGNIAGADSPNQFHSPTLTTLGGALSASAAAHQVQTAIDATEKPIFAQSMVFDTSALSAAIRAAAFPALSA